MFKKNTLSFDLGNLEPYISINTVNLHYNKHHAGYEAKLNTAIEQNQPELFEKSLEEILVNLKALVKPEIQTAVLNNGGQVYNHNMYWKCLCKPNQKRKPEGELLLKIENTFGSFEKFQEQFSTVANTKFGSGWIWLCADKNGNLEIETSSNADSPLLYGKTPIMCVDVWEHAYYLDYQNLRPEYTEAIWKVLDWTQIEKMYSEAKQQN